MPQSLINRLFCLTLALAAVPPAEASVRPITIHAITALIAAASVNEALFDAGAVGQAAPSDDIADTE